MWSLSFKLALFCLVAFPRSVYSEDRPKSLLGFLASGKTIGLRDSGLRTHSDEFCPDFVTLTILTNQQAEMEQDISKLDRSALAKKYSDLGEKAEEHMSEFVASLESTKSELPRGTRYGEPQISISPSAGKLHRVIHVGDDYVLLEPLDDPSYRFVLNVSAIQRLVWYTGPRYATSVKHLHGQETEQ